MVKVSDNRALVSALLAPEKLANARAGGLPVSLRAGTLYADHQRFAGTPKAIPPSISHDRGQP